MCYFCIDCQDKSPSPVTVHRSAPVWVSMRIFADVCTNKNSILYAQTHLQSHTHVPTHTHKYLHTQRAEKTYIFSLFNRTLPPFYSFFVFAFSLCVSVLFVHFFFTMCNVLQATFVANIEYLPHVAQLQMGYVKK